MNDNREDLTFYVLIYSEEFSSALLPGGRGGVEDSDKIINKWFQPVKSGKRKIRKLTEDIKHIRYV